jgi:aldehyde dehydrogenase (NAD+)
MMSAARHYIDGRWVEGDGARALEVVNPASEELVARFQSASVAQARQAIHAARRAFDAGPWPRLSGRERSRILFQLADELRRREAELIDLTVREAGCTMGLAHTIQVTFPIDHMYYFAEQAARPTVEPLPPVEGPMTMSSMVVREPVGVVAAITPWNFPFFLALWKVGHALATGNTIVLKPASYTPLTALEIARAAEAVDLPAGVLNVVAGGGAEIGEELAASPLVDKISLTGSTDVGKRVMQLGAANVKRIALELGGKSAAIVLDDADLDKVTSACLMGFLIHSGQACGASTRILAPRSLYGALVERMVGMAPFLTVGDPAEMTTVVGPLIRGEHRARVERYVERGIDEGATLACGGRRPAHLAKGFYLEPTIFTDVDNRMTIAQEEIFGPVGVVIPFTDDDDAVRIANDSIYGLAGSVYSSNTSRALAVARAVRTGTMMINGGGINPHAPFGGYKQSGIGREMGTYGLDEYTEIKHIGIGLL